MRIKDLREEAEKVSEGELLAHRYKEEMLE